MRRRRLFLQAKVWANFLLYQAHGRMIGQKLAYVGLEAQEPLSDADLARVRTIAQAIREMIFARAEYIHQHKLLPDIHLPGGIWADPNVLRLAEVLLRDELRFASRLRLLAPIFTGYEFLAYSQAAAMVDSGESPAALDKVILSFISHQDKWIARTRAMWSVLPRLFHVRPPPRLGEVGSMINGAVVNHDTAVYQERISLLYEAGILRMLEAAAGSVVPVVEIGGGYGALALHLRRMVPAIDYPIVDLPESLLFAGIYLALTAPEVPLKLYDVYNPTDFFCASPGFKLIPNYAFDVVNREVFPARLAINTLSLSEMRHSQADYYGRRLREVLDDDGLFFEQKCGQSSDWPP